MLLRDVTSQEEYFHLDRNYSWVSDKQCDSCLLDRPHDSPCIRVEKRSMSAFEWLKYCQLAVKRFQLIVWVIWSIHLRARLIARGWDSRVFVSVSGGGRASVWLECSLSSQNTLLARVLVRSYTGWCQSGARSDHHSSHYQGLGLGFVNLW